MSINIDQSYKFFSNQGRANYVNMTVCFGHYLFHAVENNYWKRYLIYNTVKRGTHTSPNAVYVAISNDD